MNLRKVSISAISIFFVCSVAFFVMGATSTKQQGAYHVFQTGVYQAYLNQLHSSFPEEGERSHGHWVQKIRERLTTQDLSSELCQWLFLGPNLNDSFAEVFYALAPEPSGDFSEYLIRTRSVLSVDPTLNKRAHPPAYDDPFYFGNIPSLFSRSPIPVIRMGKPLIKKSLMEKAPSVCPLFAEFLRLQPSHLYVNLMKRAGSEALSTQVIEGLEKGHPHVFVITLDKDSSFYHQKNEWEGGKIAIKSFKEAFLAHMTKKSGAFYFTRRLPKDVLFQSLTDALDHVHQQYFAHLEQLSEEERKDFIELSYLKILDDLVERLQPASMNISCRQGVDRGPSLLVLWLLSHQEISKKEAAALLFGPPVVFHNRISHSSRIVRFASAVRRIENSNAF